MGSIDNPSKLEALSSYSVPNESERVFRKGILANPSISKDLPQEALDFADSVHFTGSAVPSIPINWRFAESAASLHGLQAAVIAAFLKRKYSTDISSATINTDHAQLFFMSTLLWAINPEDPDKTITTSVRTAKISDYITNYDIHNMSSSPHRVLATNIYRTKDNKFFHLHGSMDPNPTLDSIDLPHDGPAQTYDEAMAPFVAKLATIDSADMQTRASETYRQAGVIANSVASFKETEHGKANAHVGLFEIHAVPNASQPASWWPSSSQTSASRPLAGLKVVDLTRVIAAPAVTRGLAELGASVMRVTSPNLVDFSNLHIDLNWGKWNTSIDLKSPKGPETLKKLILEADVVVQGYRPGVLDKYGFSQEGIIDICKGRERGIISARENCYGWNGPWQGRSGWQQISDACVGISEGFGRAMGLKDGEAVTPVFPNSDYMTGIAGVTGILCALMRRAEHGGSYKVDLALNYYNQWLANSCGEYPEAVWKDVWERNGGELFRSTHNMAYTIPRVMGMIMKNSKDILFREEFFEIRETGAFIKEGEGKKIKIRAVKPIIRYGRGEVKSCYNVGTRGNGRDRAKWPEDLMVEIVN